MMDTDDNILEKNDKSPLPLEVWLDFQKKESQELNESFEETQKSRRKREMTLVIMLFSFISAILEMQKKTRF